MEILGYSERGLLNSLFFEMKYVKNSIRAFNDFLSLITFPFGGVDYSISNIAVLIEQSFSDFGDADAVLLLDNKKDKQAIFIEAKVKTALRKSWNLYGEFMRFEARIVKNKVSSSNLFTQIYHKLRLVEGLNKGGKKYLESGITFPPFSSKTKRKIGCNEVVLRAIEKVEPYTEQTYYVALVPDQKTNVENFFSTYIEKRIPLDLSYDDLKHWGYLTWEEVEGFCRKKDLRETIKVFDFNKGQVY